MFKFFYGSKNIIGLLLILVPVLGFLFFATSEDMFPVLILSVIIGIPFARCCYNCLSFKFWLCIASLIANYSMFLSIYWKNTPIEYIGCILLGVSAGGLIFVLTPNIVIGWFRINKTLVFGAVLSSSLLFAFFFEALLSSRPFASIFLGLMSMMVSSTLFLEKPVLINFGEYLDETSHSKKSRIKSCLFFLLISVSIAVVCRIGYMDSLYSIGSLSAFSGGEMKPFLINAGMISGPALISFFTDKKGIYSGCIMLLFLSELSVMSVGFYNQDSFMSYAGYFVFGALLTSTLIVCSLLTYYLLGPACFNQNLSKIIIFFPLGIAAVLPMKNLDYVNFQSYPIVIGTLFMLVVGFFTVFSAWKHRLVLLKKS